MDMRFMARSVLPSVRRPCAPRDGAGGEKPTCVGTAADADAVNSGCRGWRCCWRCAAAEVSREPVGAEHGEPAPAVCRCCCFCAERSRFMSEPSPMGGLDGGEREPASAIRGAVAGAALTAAARFGVKAGGGSSDGSGAEVIPA